MIIIDPGHGGTDYGGGTNIYFKEKDLNQKISNYQHQRFNDLGIANVLTRTGDVTLPPNERIERINTLGATNSDILISNHINNGNDRGGEVIYSIRGNGDLPNKIANELKQTGLSIRNVYTRLGRTGKDFYFILRNTAPNNAMIIEYGFADDDADTERLLYNWPDLAESVVKAIAEYLNVPYQEPTKIIHIVKPNESLYTISSKYGVPINKIKKDNNLTSDIIYPQAELIINK